MGWFPQQAGGLNRVFYYLMHHFPEAGVQAHGLVAGDPLPGEPNLTCFAPAHASMLARWRAARRMTKELMHSQAFDLVASHFALYTFPSADVVAKKPFVMHFHGPWALESAVEGNRGVAVRFKTFVEQSVYRRAQRFIVLSEAFREVLHTTYGIPLDRITIIPGGVEVSRFASTLSRSEARAQLGWPTDRPTLFVVRRLARRMGLETLIEAMQSVVKAVPEVQLFIAGKGPLADELGRRVEAAALADHVTLLGFLPDDDLPLAYRAADLSVVPTEALEGFGLITIESLAAGTPVMVTPVGGLPEAVRGLSEAMVFDGMGPAVLADGLVAALKGERGLPDAAACAAYARDHHDWSVIAKKTQDVYAQVLA